MHTSDPVGGGESGDPILRSIRRNAIHGDGSAMANTVDSHEFPHKSTFKPFEADFYVSPGPWQR